MYNYILESLQLFAVWIYSIMNIPTTQNKNVDIESHKT